MFIAGSCTLYSTPPNNQCMGSMEDMPLDTQSHHTRSNKFSMSSILEHHVPKTAACLVVASPSRPLVANTFSRQLKFGVDRILANNECPPKRACSPMSEMASLSSRPCASCLISRNCCGISCPFGPHMVPTLGHAQSHPYGQQFPTTIVSPQPLIPFPSYAVYSPLASEMHHHHHHHHQQQQQQESKGHHQQIAPGRPMIHQQGHHHQLHNHHQHHHAHHQGSSPGKRKRSWSRAVFSNLQRKGLEKRFQIQKYITKPDRRQLAATLGLTDAQVKVWFQNRRMKWRHSKEAKESFAQQQDQQQKPKADTTIKTNNGKSEEVMLGDCEDKSSKLEDGRELDKQVDSIKV